MKHAHAKMTFLLLFISSLAFLFMGCGESGSPGGSSGEGVTAAITLNAGAPTLPADGKSSTAITAVLTDSSGKPVLEYTSVIFRTSLGAFKNGAKEYKVQTVDESGTVIATLTAGDIAGDAEVWVESNKVKQRLEVKFYDPHKVGTIALRTDASSMMADGASRMLVIATVTDALGNPETGATVTFKTTLGQFDEANPIAPGIVNRTTTAVTDYAGEARVMLISGTTTGTAALQASLGGLTANASVVFTAGDAKTLTLRAAPSTIRPNGATQLYAKVLDINGNSIEGKTIVFTDIVNASEGALASVTAVTNVNGEAQVGYTAGKNPGADTLQAALQTDMSLKASTSVTVDPGAIVINSITVTSGAASLVADGVSKAKIRATVTDVDGNPAIGKTVNFTSTAGTLSPASAVTNDTGVAEAFLQSTTIAGPAAVSAECDGFIGRTSITFIPGPAHHILMYPLPDTVPPNGAFSTAAIVMDQYDNRIDDQRLILQIRLAGGTNIVDSAELTPDQAEDGVYKFEWTAAGAYGEGNLEITAKVNNGVSAKVTVVVDEKAILVGSVTVVAGAEAIEANGKDATTIRATVLDNTGAPAKGIEVDFTTTLGKLSPKQIKTDANGIAQTTLYSETVWGTAIITADANGFRDQVEVRFSSGHAGGLILTALPNTVLPGGKSTIIAELNNGRGAPVADETLYFVIAENNTNGVITPTKGVTDESGRVYIEYTGGIIEGTDHIKVTAASNSSLTDTVPVKVEIGAVAVGSIALSATITSLPADGSSSTAITATVLDLSGNPIPEGTAVSFETDRGTFTGGLKQLTVNTMDDTGKVMVSLVAPTKADAGIATVTATVKGVSQSIKITFRGDNVGYITLIADPATIPADNASSTNITAIVYDATGKPMPSGTEIHFNTSLGAFSNKQQEITLTTTDDTGTVVVSLISGKTPGKAVITATATATGVTQSTTVTFRGDDVGYITLDADPDEIPADNASSTSITAIVYDATGNPVPSGTEIRFKTSLGAFSNKLKEITLATTNATGKIVLSLIAGNVPGQAVITATATVTGVTQSITVSFTGGTVGDVQVFAEKSKLKANGVDQTIITATVKTAAPDNQAVEGAVVSFSTTGGVITTPFTTDKNGQAKATLTSDRYNGEAEITAFCQGVSDKTTVIFEGVTLVLSANPEVSFFEENGTDKSKSRITALLKDAENRPIENQTIKFELVDAEGNSPSENRGTFEGDFITDASGNAIVDFIPNTSGEFYVKATTDVLGSVAPPVIKIVFNKYQLILTVNPMSIRVNETAVITAILTENGIPAPGTVFFSATHGVLVGGSEIRTDAGTLGEAITTLKAGHQTGKVTITANAVPDTGNGVTITAILDTLIITGDAAKKIVLKSDPGIIAVNTGNAAISAVVYDEEDQPVGGQNLYFRIKKGPGGGEQLYQSIVTTDAYGKAAVQLKAGSIPSTHIGDVVIEAWLKANFTGDVYGAANLTISGPVAFISVGVNLELVSTSQDQGHIEAGVSGIATDINGNPVADNSLINFSVTSIAFDEDRADDRIIHCWDANGNPINDCATQYGQFPGDLGVTWFSDDINGDKTMRSLGGPMAASEDTNQNGILDSGEDKNGNHVLDPPQGVTIDSPRPTTNGIATSTVYYPMSYAENVKVRISAEAGGVTNYYDATLLCTDKMEENFTCGREY